MRSEILTQAKARGVMITTAESCTAGMVSAALTDLAGASAVFDRGFVTYTNAAKVEMLGVDQHTLDEYGAVSEQVASEMARGALSKSAAQVSVSLTGIAGPGGSEHKPEGRVCFGIQGPLGIRTETKEFGPLGRDSVRQAATDHALFLIHKAISELP